MSQVSLSDRLEKKNKTGIDWNQINAFTPEMTYILGLLWADGLVSRRKDIKNGTVRLGSHPDDMEYFRGILDKVGRWSYGSCRKKKPNKEEYHYIANANIYSVEFVDWLIDQGYVGKSFNSPTKIFETIPENLHHYWFLGLFDGDGSVGNISLDAHISSGYEQDWTYVSNLLDKLGADYFVNRYRNAKRGGGDIVISRTSVLKFFDYIYQSDMGLPRKRKDADAVRANILKRAEKRTWSKYIRPDLKKGIFHVVVPEHGDKNPRYLSTHKTRSEAIVARDEYCQKYGISIEEMHFKGPNRSGKKIMEKNRFYEMS